MLTTLFLFLNGIFFALIQLSYFLLLEAVVSSTIFTYFMVTLSWLSGVVVGLIFSRRFSLSFLIGLNFFLFLLFLFLLHRFPYDTGLFLVYGFCVGGSALLSGALFARWERVLPKPDLFFFVENNGFLLGIVLALSLFMLFGRFVLFAAIGGVGLLLFLLQLVLRV